jgi:hypothetical protein
VQADAEGDEMLRYSNNKQSKTFKKEEMGNPSIYYLTSINDSLLQVIWGKLVCEILSKDWEAIWPQWMLSRLPWSPWFLPTK